LKLDNLNFLSVSIDGTFQIFDSINFKLKNTFNLGDYILNIFLSEEKNIIYVLSGENTLS